MLGFSIDTTRELEDNNPSWLNMPIDIFTIWPCKNIVKLEFLVHCHQKQTPHLIIEEESLEGCTTSFHVAHRKWHQQSLRAGGCFSWMLCCWNGSMTSFWILAFWLLCLQRLKGGLAICSVAWRRKIWRSSTKGGRRRWYTTLVFYSITWTFFPQCSE